MSHFGAEHNYNLGNKSDFVFRATQTIFIIILTVFFIVAEHGTVSTNLVEISKYLEAKHLFQKIIIYLNYNVLLYWIETIALLFLF